MWINIIIKVNFKINNSKFKQLTKFNLIYFLIVSIIVFLLIHTGILYNVYINPTKELFSDFLYLFKIANCHHQGFDVYSVNTCYRDYYGSYLYGPLVLLIPSMSLEMVNFIIYPISTLLILLFVYLTVKILKPNNVFKYFLASVILLNPVTFFLYERLNIDIIIYIFLILLVYSTKRNYIQLLIISCLTLIKFYPAVLSILFIIKNKNKIIKGLFYSILSLTLLMIFIYIFWENLKSIAASLEFVSQSFRYSFSLNSFSKILSHLLNNENILMYKIILIFGNLFLSLVFFNFFLNKIILNFDIQSEKNLHMFILSATLSISLYLIFGNNFYREIYLIGVMPYLINKSKIKFFTYFIYIYLFKLLYLLIFFPYYYKSNLGHDKTAQILIGLKSSIDYMFIALLLSILLLIFKTYYNIFKKNLLK